MEEKRVPNGNSGCEDPRLTVADDTIYMFYRAYNGVEVPRVALSSISVENFLAEKWEWSEPVIISPPGVDDKDACVFPEKIGGRYVIIHRVGHDIDLAYADDMNFDKCAWDEKGCTWLEEYRWITPRRGMWDDLKVGVAAPPIKTEDGWILFYHGVSSEDRFYRVGVCLLDLNDPSKILARLDQPVFEPEEDYELRGEVSNVVFPCGVVLKDDLFYLYYGGADEVVGVVTINKDELMESLNFYHI